MHFWMLCGGWARKSELQEYSMRQQSVDFSLSYSGKTNLCGLSMYIGSLRSLHWLRFMCMKWLSTSQSNSWFSMFCRMSEGGMYTALSVWLNDINDMLLKGDLPQLAVVVSV